jgi:hypothetical protein
MLHRKPGSTSSPVWWEGNRKGRKRGREGGRKKGERKGKERGWNGKGKRG